MVERGVLVGAIRMPALIYGTAWKEEETERLTSLALAAGFVGFDTANQRRHYFEAGVGAALNAALAAGALERADLFVQTKFTYADGQDHRLPYDPTAPVAKQVEQSLASSLEHLRVDYLDSYVLHGPSRRRGLGQVDREAWAAMEGLCRAGQTRLLGISNVTLAQLEELYATASIKPAVVQNRCYAATGWDQTVRTFCAAHGVAYQGFSLLTANLDVLRHGQVAQIAARVGRTVAQVIFRFALQTGMVALTGTTSAEHMKQDLDVHDFELAGAEVAGIEGLLLGRRGP